MDEITAARKALKWELLQEGDRCACGEYGATQLAHIIYTRHPDSVELYHKLNCCVYHGKCNTTGEALWINVNACLILLGRAGGPEKWKRWARSLPRKGEYWIPDKMRIAMDLWNGGVRAFELDKIRGAFLTSDGGLEQLDDHVEWLKRWKKDYSQPPNGR